MSGSSFSAMTGAASSVLHVLHGQPARLFPKRHDPAKGPNAPRETDPTRAVTPCQVIRTEAPARMSNADVGVGTQSGMLRMSPNSTRRLVTFPASVGVLARQGDEITFDDRPDVVYRLGETLPGDLPGLTFVFLDVA